MTHIYFVRHAEPDFGWQEDRTRPLTAEGLKDSEKVTEALMDIKLDYAISSPYKRSRDTIKGCVEAHGLEMHFDERLRERVSGPGSNTREMIRKRWENMNFHEEDGEALGTLQQRNMEALFELLKDHSNKKIIIGTHGSALSTILNHYNPDFGQESFFRIINFMPYIIRLDFDGTRYNGQEEILIVTKEFKAPVRK